MSPVSCGWAPSRELNERYTPLICCSIEKGGRLKRNLYPILMQVCVVYFIIIDIVTAQYWGEALVVQQLGCSCATLITNRIFFAQKIFISFQSFQLWPQLLIYKALAVFHQFQEQKTVCWCVYVCMYVCAYRSIDIWLHPIIVKIIIIAKLRHVHELQQYHFF